VGSIAVILGYAGSQKKQIFSLTAMVLAAVSLIFFNLLNMGIIKPAFTQATGRKHLANSIYATIDAFEILKSSPLDKSKTNELILHLQQAAEEAKQVNIEQIELQVPGFALHYKDEFIQGINLLLDGYQNEDGFNKLQGGVLLDKWALWNNENNDKLDNIKEPDLSVYSFVQAKI
jgi:hypothetical protein